MQSISPEMVMNQITRSKLEVISKLQSEIDHFQRTLITLKDLPSCRDKKMPEAFEAYQKMVEVYNDMISVRQKLINELRATL